MTKLCSNLKKKHTVYGYAVMNADNLDGIYAYVSLISLDRLHLLTDGNGAFWVTLPQMWKSKRTHTQKGKINEVARVGGRVVRRKKQMNRKEISRRARDRKEGGNKCTFQF
jgi:hypothetical protein